MIYTPVIAFSSLLEHRDRASSIVELLSESLWLLVKRFFHSLECAIVYVVSCLAVVSFHPSSLVQSYGRR